MSHKLVSLYIGDGEYYTRTDADAVIAELKADYKEACDRLQTANLIKDEQLATARHHKYKRCLAMARWCKSKSEIYNEFAADAAEYKSSYEARFRRKAEHYEKWNNRYLKIAEKFKDKEAK